jgi:hypothetical protein
MAIIGVTLGGTQSGFILKSPVNAQCQRILLFWRLQTLSRIRLLKLVLGAIKPQDKTHSIPVSPSHLRLFQYSVGILKGMNQEV